MNPSVEKATGWRRWRHLLDIATTIAMLVASGVLVWAALRNQGSVASAVVVPAQPIPLADASLDGSDRAPVLLLIFSDFECPFCQKFELETLPSLRREFVLTGQVQIAFWNFPLPIHSMALEAARYAECAERQGQFWLLHDRLFGREQAIDRVSLRAIVRSLPGSGGDIVECVASTAADKAVQSDLKLGRALGVTGTPTIFIGRRQAGGTVHAVAALVGAQPIDAIRSAIAKVL